MHAESSEHANRVVIHHHRKVNDQFSAGHTQVCEHIVVKIHCMGDARQLFLGHGVCAGALDSMWLHWL
jgi:hypothetical protein